MTEINTKKEEIESPLKNLMKFRDAALSCIHCGQCRVANFPEKNFYYVCPVYKTEVTPKFEPYFARGKNVILKGLLWGDLRLNQEVSELIFQCTLCGACEDFCHNAHNESIEFKIHTHMDHVNVFEALRADLVEAGFPIEAQIPMNKSLVEFLNPYGRDNEDKSTWKKNLKFKIKDASEENAEILYFVGCTAALTPQIQNIAITTAKILNKLNTDYAIFDKKEICCGSIALRTGDLKAFEEIAEKNTKLFKEKGIKTIITSCAGCYRTLKKDYNDRLNEIEILHTVEYLSKLIKEGNLKLNKLDLKLTYHDPCHLGRHMGIYDEPRIILNEISDLREMKSNRESAMCCGAGGGVKKGFPDLSIEMAKNRVKDAEEMAVDMIVSSCPFCYRNISDAIDVIGTNIKMVDIVELFFEALKS